MSNPMNTPCAPEPGQQSGIPAVPDTSGSGATIPAYGPLPKVQKEKHVFTKAELLLLPAALLLGILYDRLVVEGVLFSPPRYAAYRFFGAIFWLAFLALYYVLYWSKLKSNKMLWMVTGCAVALCCWNFFFDYRNEYGAITYYVVPGVLMAHAVVLQGGYRLKQVRAIAGDWLGSWFTKPFTALGKWAGAIGCLFEGKGNAQKVLIALGISLPLLLVIVPLLGSADLVFGYYVSNLFADLQMDLLIFHTVVSVLGFMLFYSFLWNLGREQAANAPQVKELRLDTLICSVVLGVILLVYLLFCAVQFTYLFARAGLPIDMTYSEYAREGFWQLIVVTGINLVLFGVLLQYGGKSKALRGMLAGLLCATAVILVSGFIRLGLYITIYGLTWLRLLSAWFILFLAVVLVLCGVRMLKPAIPLVGLCALILLAWYTVLGYFNPDALIIRYNLSRAEQQQQWVEENFDYLMGLSDNAVLELLSLEIGAEQKARIAEYRGTGGNDRQGMSLSSVKTRNALRRARIQTSSHGLTEEVFR